MIIKSVYFCYFKSQSIVPSVLILVQRSPFTPKASQTPMKSKVILPNGVNNPGHCFELLYACCLTLK